MFYSKFCFFLKVLEFCKISNSFYFISRIQLFIVMSNNKIIIKYHVKSVIKIIKPYHNYGFIRFNDNIIDKNFSKYNIIPRDIYFNVDADSKLKTGDVVDFTFVCLPVNYGWEFYGSDLTLINTQSEEFNDMDPLSKLMLQIKTLELTEAEMLMDSIYDYLNSMNYFNITINSMYLHLLFSIVLFRN